MNQDYTKRVGYRLDALDWEASPAPGVWRKKLERQGAESGRATSLVRYDPGSRFQTHQHDGGEEILVLEGTISDESGDYPAGSYFRNPPGTSHAPSSVTGCVLFVKLCYFRPDDRTQLATTIADSNWQPTSASPSQLLYGFDHDTTSLLTLAENESIQEAFDQTGFEIFVIQGEIAVDKETYPAYSWLRVPKDDRATLHATSKGALLLVKRGHFPEPEIV